MYPPKLVQDQPLFCRDEIQCSSGPGVTHLTVTNGYASMVIVGGVILRYPVSNPRNMERMYIQYTCTVVCCAIPLRNERRRGCKLCMCVFFIMPINVC